MSQSEGETSNEETDSKKPRAMSETSTAFVNHISVAQNHHYNSATRELEIPDGFYGLVTKIVNHQVFTCFINTVIVLSAVQMGLQANKHNSDNNDVNLVRDIFENIVTAIFAAELVMRVAVLGRKYFVKVWNVFDGIIALTSMIYVWILPLMNHDGLDFSIIRVFRLLRLFRVLKLMKAIPQFRMLMEGIVASMQALFWVCLMLAVTVYTFAIFCVEIIGDADQDVYPGFSANDDVIHEAISGFNNYEYFGNLSRAMMSLLSISLLAEWSAIRPVWELQTWCLPVIFVLVFITSFGFVNVIIGVIVESTTESMQEMHSHLLLERKNTQMAMIRRLAEHIWAHDLDADGRMTKLELRGIGKNPLICEMLDDLGLPKGFTFDDLFTTLNVHGKETLVINDFLVGMERLIFSTDFQKDCLRFMAMGQVQELHRLQKTALTDHFNELREELHIMHKEVLESVKASGNTVLAHPVLASSSCDEAGFDSHSWPDSATREAADELVVSPQDVNPKVTQCGTMTAARVNTKPLPRVSDGLSREHTPTHVRFNLGPTLGI